MNDLVSVIVPVYQAERYLDRCIRSIAGQSYKHLEIILVDDGSVDRSLEICRRSAASDPRIRVIHQENGGVSRARNAGFAAMTGDYLLLVDADDYIRRDMVKDLLTAIHQGQADMAVCGFEFVYEDGRERDVRSLDAPFYGSREEFVNALLLETYDKLMMNTQNNKLYSISLIRSHGVNYDERLSINEDVLFCMEMLRRCRRVACIPGSYLCYWQYARPQSLVTRFNENGLDSCFVLLRSVWRCLRDSHASLAVQHGMNNRMIYHICGFLGLYYSRSNLDGNGCLAEVKRLADRRPFRRLLSQTRVRGVKNRIAALLLGQRWCTIYHWLCLIVYREKRRRYRRR